MKVEQAIRDMLAGSEKGVNFVDGAAQIRRVLGRQKSPNDCGAVRRKVFSRKVFSRKVFSRKVFSSKVFSRVCHCRPAAASLSPQSAYHRRIGNCGVRKPAGALRAAPQPIT